MLDGETVMFDNVKKNSVILLRNKLCIKINRDTVVDQNGHFIVPEINEQVIPVEV